MHSDFLSARPYTHHSAWRRLFGLTSAQSDATALPDGRSIICVSVLTDLGVIQVPVTFALSPDLTIWGVSSLIDIVAGKHHTALPVTLCTTKDLPCLSSFRLEGLPFPL